MTLKDTTVSAQTLVSNGSPASKFPQYLAALLATIGGFCLGTVLGWTSPAGPKASAYYGLNIDESAIGWIGAFMAMGGIVGCPQMSWMMDLFGRKKTIMILAIPTFISWMLLIFAPSIFVICAARFILGFTTGAYAVSIPLYTTEISENDIRGTLGTYFQLQLTMGITATYILGAFMGIFWLSMICAIAPVLLFAAMFIVPESPIYYLKKFRMDDARRSLQWLRGSHYDVEPELQMLKANLDQMEAERVPITQAFTTPSAKRGLVIGLGVMFFQQFSGVNAVIFYTQNIFVAAGSDIDASVSTIIVGVVMVVMTYVATLVVDKAGRRPLLLLSAFVMAICTSAMGVYFYLKKVNPDFAKTIGLLPLSSLCIFIVVFSLGFGPIPWMFMSEIFPPQIKGAACSIACLFNWCCVFFVTKFFGDLQAKFGSYGTFWIFSAISLAGTFFVWNLVPETKGKSMEEIQRELGATPQLTAEDQVESGQKPTKF